MSLYNESRETTSTPPRSWAWSAWSTGSRSRRPGSGWWRDPHRGPRPRPVDAVRLPLGLAAGPDRFPAELDLALHAAVCDLVRDLVNDGLVLGVHDTADGGLGLALAEMAVASGVGCGHGPGRLPLHWLFGESPSRFVLAVDHAALGELHRRHGRRRTRRRVGRAGGDRLTIGGGTWPVVDVAVADATGAWRGRLPAVLGHGDPGLDGHTYTMPVATTPVEVGVRDLQNNLSRYLDRVSDGLEIVVTERGRPVARLLRIDEPADRLADLSPRAWSASRTRDRLPAPAHPRRRLR